MDLINQDVGESVSCNVEREEQFYGKKLRLLGNVLYYHLYTILGFKGLNRVYH
jgi:hypothetical protein